MNGIKGFDVEESFEDMKKLYMKRLSILLILFFSLPFMQSCSKRKAVVRRTQVTPVPANMVVAEGHFILKSRTALYVLEGDSTERSLAGYLAGLAAPATGFHLKIRDYNENTFPATGIVFNRLPGTGLGPEGYKLEVRKHRILISANEDAGLFYGIQTLRQLLPDQIESRSRIKSVLWDIPCLDITDQPRFKWRGMHLDVSRHFFKKEFIKKYIDLIAFHKMNVFHWHLVDTQGWRLEIKKYPELTETGAWRVDRKNNWRTAKPQQPGEKPTYGGFYTRDDIKDIVKYASERFVTIVPEIEMPGHSAAALAAYPEFSCTGQKSTVPPGGRYSGPAVYCAGNDSTFTFLEDILTEVMDLFPSKYIHIGGDEVNKSAWKKCRKCQQRMKDEGLENEDELQSYFIRRMEKFLVAHDRKLIGWDEILEGGLAPEATVMSWRGMEGGIAAAKMQHDVVMSPGSYCYFDYYQADPATEPEAIGGYTTLKKVYSFEPVPAALNAGQAKHILGAQGNVWTEFMKTPEHVEYMILPRMTALSEVLWSPAKKRNWDDFNQRVNHLFNRFNLMGLNYSEGSYQVDISVESDPRTKKVFVKLGSEQADPVIYYTLNGQDPDTLSFKYTEPVLLDSTTVVKASIIKKGETAGRVSSRKIVVE